MILYTLEHCPNCLQLKSKLIACGYEFTERPMDTAESITEMRVNGCFAMEAPVLQCDDKFYEYCDCMEDNFFGTLFHMRGDQKEIPEFDEIHESTT